MSRDKGILLSEKHGVNPSITLCECCGKEIGIALFGKLKGDVEAPRYVHQGLCDDCQGVINQGGVMIIEVRDGETGRNPYRTGRVVGCTKEFKERNNIEHPIVYMEKTLFSSIFDESLKNQNENEQ